MELASSVPMKVLYREKWESVPKGHIVSVSIREGREKKHFLDNGGKTTWSVVNANNSGLECHAWCDINMFATCILFVLLVMPEQGQSKPKRQGLKSAVVFPSRCLWDF